MNTRWRIIAVTSVLLFSAIYFVPNVATISWWPSNKQIRYGLDIQGGLYLVMGVDIPSVLRENAHQLGDYIVSLSKEKELGVLGATRVTEPADSLDVIVKLAPGADEKKFLDTMKDMYGNTMAIVSSGGGEVRLRYSDAYILQLKKSTVEQSIETIRNRIDEFGVSEPSIAAQGDDRILIQLPGLKDATQAKELINRTARLEFHLLEEGLPQDQLAGLVAEAEKAGSFDIKGMKYSEYIKKLNEALKAKLPAGSVLLFGKNENATNMESGKVPYLLKSNVPLAGDSLKNANVRFNEYNEPYVELRFNPDGANKFAALTAENVHKQLAIVLDNVVYSAPVINEKIPSGVASISLGGGRNYDTQLAEAKNISMALRAGALPAALEQLEERAVGPTLGMDSIAKGKKASIIGAIFVVLFMILYYGGIGLVADFALCVNIFLILSVLTALGAVLTLPGIAGIALTIGMSVDSNIVIFERIREELRAGASPRTAVAVGYSRAFWAIFDSNLVSAIICLILMHYGTGPVRGFAVTLLTGIATSFFSAIFVTRAFTDILLARFDVKRFSMSH